MAIFDAKKTQFLTFYIVLTDAEKVKEYQSRQWVNSPNVPPGVVNRAPYNPGPPESGAAVEFGAPWRGYRQPALSDAPYSWTPWENGVNPYSGPYPIHVATFTRRSGGFLGIGGTTIRYYWMGQFELAPAADGSIPDPDGPPGSTIPEAQQQPVPKRRWIEGFEHPYITHSTAVAIPLTRDASRHVGGFGFAYRGASSQYVQIALNTYDNALVSPDSWERFYFRLRRKPTTAVNIWRAALTTSASAGVALSITATGQLAVFIINTSNVWELQGTYGSFEEWTGRADHHAWHKVDVLLQFATTKVFRLVVDGELLATVQLPASVVPDNANHAFSRLGNSNTGTNDLEVDLDDWHNAELPLALLSKDFVQGTKIVPIKAQGFGTGTTPAAWTGDYRVAAQQTLSANNNPAPAFLSSATGGAQLAIATDSDLKVDADPQAVGVAALLVSSRSRNLGGAPNSGEIGYKLAGGADVLDTISETTVVANNAVLYTVPGTDAQLPDVTPIELLYKQGPGGTAEVLSLMGQAELVGMFGPEDFVPQKDPTTGEPVAPPKFPGALGTHNAPYPHSPWVREAAAPPLAPYIVVGGTYVGNGTGQDLTFRAPVQFLVIRNTAGASGVFWLSPSRTGHKDFQTGITAHLVDAEEDAGFSGAPGEDSQQQRYRVRIAGGDAVLNANGVTYQYIAVCDPGMRFCHNLDLAHATAAPALVRPLIHPTFDAGFAFVHIESVDSTSTVGLYAQGPESAAGALDHFSNSAAVANALTRGTPGEITTGPGLHTLAATRPCVVSLWRRSDGVGDPNEAAAVCFGGYIGDGAASRTIALAPQTGKRPLFAMVFPANTSAGVYRDPSHTGTNSTNATGTNNPSTGITAGGIDSFTVGSSLNASGVAYNYFVLFADATAGNNGWGNNGEYIPVEPAPPVDGPWPDVPDTIEDGDDGPDGPSIPDDITTDLEASCLPFTVRIANLALSRIGISKQIVDLTTDESQEAETVRLHYGSDVEQTLRDFDWPLATRYANLVLVAGTDTTPVNEDWQYAYRAPADMLKARRLVGRAGQRRNWDPDPPKFRVGSDADGVLIYTDEPSTPANPLQLEYTVRLPCPGSMRDPHFRSALAWRLAHSLSHSLARDERKATYCETMYQRTLLVAKTQAAREQQQAKDGDADWIAARN